MYIKCCNDYSLTYIPKYKHIAVHYADINHTMVIVISAYNFITGCRLGYFVLLLYRIDFRAEVSVL